MMHHLEMHLRDIKGRCWVDLSVIVEGMKRLKWVSSARRKIRQYEINLLSSMEKATAFCVYRATTTDIKVMNSSMNVIFPQNDWTQAGDFVCSKVYRHRINNEKSLFQHPIINILLCRHTFCCFCTPITSI